MERIWIKIKTIMEDEELLVLKRTLNESENNPRNISARRNATRWSAATLNRIIRKEFRLCQQKVKVRQKLKENDFQRRSDSSYWFLQQFINARIPSNIVIGDKALFAMNDAVNAWNVREYAPYFQNGAPIYCFRAVRHRFHETFANRVAA